MRDEGDNQENPQMWGGNHLGPLGDACVADEVPAWSELHVGRLFRQTDWACLSRAGRHVDERGGLLSELL